MPRIGGWLVALGGGGAWGGVSPVTHPPTPPPQDTHIRCWDLRSPERPLLAMERRVATNQRVTFDLDP